MSDFLGSGNPIRVVYKKNHVDEDDDDDDDNNDHGSHNNPDEEDDDPPSTPTRLTGKPHAFGGAILSPKHAREISPNHCLQIASSIAEQSRTSSVPYTVWITEAWRVLGWAEPSAALFWEMATLYHALYLAAKDNDDDTADGSHARNNRYHHPHQKHPRSKAGSFPPLLHCESSSIHSGMSTHATNMSTKKHISSTISAKELPVWLVGTFLLLHCEDFAIARNLSGDDERRFFAVDTATTSNTTTTAAAAGRNNTNNSPSANALDFNTLFQQTGLSPRMRLHAGWNHDYTHCTAFLLRHLRKILLLAAISENPRAFQACTHLGAIPSSPHWLAQQRRSTASPSATSKTNTTTSSTASHRHTHHHHQQQRYSITDIRRQHDDEHGNVGLNVNLTLDDIEKLELVLQPPHGGNIDDPPLKLGEYIWNSLYEQPPPPTASIPLVDVEREIRQHLELDLTMKEEHDESSAADDHTAKAMARLSLGDRSATVTKGERTTVTSTTTASSTATTTSSSSISSSTSVVGRGSPSSSSVNMSLKEIHYTRLRGTTVFLKPNTTEISSGASAGSGDANAMTGGSGKLHDLAISDSSDVHMYLLQPFEHATISTCTGCTILVGAVAGLLHVVDCEKTTVIAAARRILVSNSCDVQICVFTPSPPLLVGDNRCCQFAPYNSYYDGLREDLLATGLAAAVVSAEGPSHSGNRTAGENNEAGWPPLQLSSNKWKIPIEVSKLEVPQVPGSTPGSPGGPNSAPSSPGADERAMGLAVSGNDAAVHAPVLVSASEFNMLLVPLESEAARQRRLSENDDAENDDTNNHPVVTDTNNNNGSGGNGPASGTSPPVESPYCRLLAEALQLSPFRLPIEYERRVLMKSERMKNIQQSVKNNLTPEQQRRFEEELNRGFRDWLVSSGNLRQVLDLVRIDRRGGI